MTQVGQYAIFRSGLTSQVVWHHLRVSISKLSRVTGENRIATSFEGRHVRWPSRDPPSSVAPGSSKMRWVATILKELGGFGRFMRNGRHFRISSYSYNGEVTKMTWPWVIRIQILRYTFNRYWWPQATVSYWSYVSYSQGVVAIF